MTPKEILIAARAKIADPKHWTQRQEARDSSGRSTYVHSDDAVCFCSLGAIASVVYESPLILNRQKVDAVIYLGRAMGTRVAAFNDTHTHEEVMLAWDRAIAQAESDEAQARGRAQGDN